MVQLEIKICKQEGGWLVTESLKSAPEHIQALRDKNTWIVQAAHRPQQYENLTCVEIMETERVMRSQSEIGALNLIPIPSLSDTQIKEAYEETVSLITEDENATPVRKAEATLKAHKAYKALEYAPQRDKVIDGLIKAPQRITRETKCPIDIKALRDFIASPASLDQAESSDGKKKGGTYRKHAKAMMRAIRPQPGPDEDVAWVTIQWKLSALGERLWEAGHVCGSREYAVGFDPFKSWGRKLKCIALSRFGYDFDDAAAYPTASLFIIDEGRDICQRFIENKEAILRGIGAYYFPEITQAMQRERAKQLIHRLDMEGSLAGWLKDWNLPETRNLYGCKIRLPDGIFKVHEYVNAQAKRTDWLVQRRPRLLQFMKLAKPKAPRIGGSVRSYILQEFEARSRLEKLRVAEEKGHTWFSLQHDGVVLGLIKGTSPVQFANTLTKYVSSTLGYTQKVEVKQMESEWTNKTPWVWDKNRDISETEITMIDSQDSTKFKEWFNRVTTCTSTREAEYTYNCIALYPIPR